MNLTQEQKVEAQVLLDEVRSTQTAFWDALLALENCIGVDVDSCKDMEDQTIDSLMEDEESEA